MSVTTTTTQKAVAVPASPHSFDLIITTVCSGTCCACRWNVALSYDQKASHNETKEKHLVGVQVNHTGGCMAAFHVWNMSEGQGISVVSPAAKCPWWKVAALRDSNAFLNAQLTLMKTFIAFFFAADCQSRQAFQSAENISGIRPQITPPASQPDSTTSVPANINAK